MEYTSKCNRQVIKKQIHNIYLRNLLKKCLDTIEALGKGTDMLWQLKFYPGTIVTDKLSLNPINFYFEIMSVIFLI